MGVLTKTLFCMAMMGSVTLCLAQAPPTLKQVFKQHGSDTTPAASLLLIAAASSAPNLTRATYIKAGHLFAGTVGGSFREIRARGGKKEFPMWSPSGSRLAYLAESGRPQSLGEIRIVTAFGQEEVTIPIQYGANSGPGVQYVESLQWITRHRVAVSGTLNPSTVETLLFDIATAKLVTVLDDDMGGAVFSPDGHHVALITGAPHFSRAEDRRPVLTIDQAKVFPEKGEHVTLLTRPVWSQDSSRLAIAAEDSATKKRYVFLWKRGGEGERIPFATQSGEDQEIHLSWAGQSFYLVAGNTVLGFRDGRVLSGLPPGGSINYQTSGIVRFRTLARPLEAVGAQDIDLWCSSCPIALLPFGQGLRVRPEEMAGEGR